MRSIHFSPRASSFVLIEVSRDVMSSFVEQPGLR